MLTALLKGASQVVLTAMICTTWVVHPALAEEEAPPQEVTKAQQKAKGPSSGELTLEDIKAKRTTAEASKALSDSDKKSVLGFLDKTIRFRELAEQYNEQAEAIAKQVAEAPKRHKEVQKELDQPPPTTESIEDEVSQIETDKLEQRIHSEETALSNAKSTFSEWESKLDGLRNRPQTLRESVSKAKARLEELRQELNAAMPADEPSELIEARRLSLLAEQVKCQTEIRASEQGLAGNEVLMSLLSAERDLAAREVTRRGAVVKVWQEQGQRRREQEAAKARTEAEQAKQRAYDLPPAIQAQLQINIKRSEELARVTEQEARVAQRLEQKQTLLKEIEEEYVLARKRVEAAALTQAIGLALRQQRQSLPELRSFRQNSAERQAMMSDLREARLQIDRERRELADLDAESDRIVSSLRLPLEGEIELMQKEVRQLLNDRRDLLEKLQAAYRRLFKGLQELEFTGQQTVSRAEAYAEFLDLHLLWMRSSKVIGLAYLRDLAAALRWITSPSNWREVAREAGRSFGRNPLAWVLGLVAGVALLLIRRYARRDLSRVAKKVGRVQTDSFVLTLRALVMTAFMAAGWPFLIGFVGIQLRLSPSAPDFTRAISVGMIVAALVLLLFGFLRNYCRKDGLAQVHFDWPESARLTLLHNLSWLLPVLLIALFLTWACELGKRPEFPDSLGRLAFVVGMITVSFFMARTLRLSGGVVTPLKMRHPDGWLVKTRGIWYPAAVGVPLLEALAAVMGYYYTAMVLWRYIHATVWFLIGVLMLQGLMLRWLLIAKRRLAFEEVKRKREAEREAARAKASDGQDGFDLDAFPLEEPEIDFDQLGEQTRSLLRIATLFAALAGLWAIWSPILPALNILEGVELWSYQAEVDGVIRRIPITLENLVQAVIVATIAIVVARNLPGVLEIILLNRLPLDAGARYAFTAICRYVITGIGIVVAFSVVGFSWSKLQWLVAALGVGLGFGLQEIVANFISGLIILFERPYRVGDVVTVGDTMGVISRIQIRATTITDWDRRELIVPNKDFITGRLINWSLSDAITRIRIPVGIAYGSDTELAEKLLLKVARKHPKVREDPPPLALFEGFGDNSLNFDLRVFVSEIGDRLSVMHALHMAIDREFRKAGITIAFPQRDVHLDAAEPLNVRVVADQNGKLEPEPEPKTKA
jgi:potassium efflux system protein